MYGWYLPVEDCFGPVLTDYAVEAVNALTDRARALTPEAKVLIISPIAPHNLNVRPIVVPDSSQIDLKMVSRDADFTFSSDNRSVLLPSGTELSVSLAQFSLKRVRLNRTNFINALTQKLFWGEDVRNIK
jgi:NAD+ kinase